MILDRQAIATELSNLQTGLSTLTLTDKDESILPS